MLTGHRIRAADLIYDYLQVRFDGGEVLNIFNDYSMYGFVAAHVDQLVGLTLTAVLDKHQLIQLEFGEDQRLCINLAENSFYGPEAMELIQTTGKRIVWP